jgi:hypothetical protein
MSVYVDIRTGKWFDTRAELLAYQRARTQAVVSGKKLPGGTQEDTEVRILVPEPQIVHNDNPASDIEQSVVEHGKEVIKDEDGIKVQLDVETMKERLRENGVDGRRLRSKTDEEIATMYFEHFAIR